MVAVSRVPHRLQENAARARRIASPYSPAAPGQAVAAVLQESGHAQGAGDFQSVHRRGGTDGSRHDSRRAHRAREHRAHRAAGGENGRRAARRKTCTRDHGRSEGNTFPRNFPD